MFPHGVACAGLLAPVVEINVASLRARQPASPALARYTEAARLLTGHPTRPLRTISARARRIEATRDVRSRFATAVKLLSRPSSGLGAGQLRVDAEAGSATNSLAQSPAAELVTQRRGRRLLERDARR